MDYSSNAIVPCTNVDRSVVEMSEPKLTVYDPKNVFLRMENDGVGVVVELCNSSGFTVDGGKLFRLTIDKNGKVNVGNMLMGCKRLGLVNLSTPKGEVI